MRVSDIMTRVVFTTTRVTTIHEAATVMSDHNVSALPVIDEHDRVVGVVSEIDCIRDRAARDPRSHLRTDPDPRPDPRRLVSSVMTTDVAKIRPEADLADVAELLVRRGIRSVPVIDDRGLVGIVSRRDLVRTLLRADAAIQADVQQLLDTHTGVAGRWVASVDDGVVTVSVPRDDVTADNGQIPELLPSLVPGITRVHRVTRTSDTAGDPSPLT